MYCSCSLLSGQGPWGPASAHPYRIVCLCCPDSQHTPKFLENRCSSLSTFLPTLTWSILINHPDLQSVDSEPPNGPHSYLRLLRTGMATDTCISQLLPCNKLPRHSVTESPNSLLLLSCLLKFFGSPLISLIHPGIRVGRQCWVLYSESQGVTRTANQAQLPSGDTGVGRVGCTDSPPNSSLLLAEFRPLRL